MTSIGLICEGVSEANMISHIIQRYLGDVDVNTIQPKIVSGKQNNFGGWLQVLDYCNDNELQKIFATNDYLVIQIDTDACIEKNYDVSQYNENNQKVSDEILYERVVQRLKKNLSAQLIQKYSNRIIFAICINETECWLLPIYYTNEQKKRCATTNCIYLINQKLKQQNTNTIPDKEKNSNEARQTYQTILKKLKKKKDIEDISQYNYGFKKFVEQLNSIST
ncbi:MAG: hypothetical protein K6F33_00070 [Bacteroidales bacterium]|nr:hypothetical protein [Bacteroidales bacterium]